jgi:hypothetical protein
MKLVSHGFFFTILYYQCKPTTPLAWCCSKQAAVMPCSASGGRGLLYVGGRQGEALVYNLV